MLQLIQAHCRAFQKETKITTEVNGSELVDQAYQFLLPVRIIKHQGIHPVLSI